MRSSISAFSLSSSLRLQRIAAVARGIGDVGAEALHLGAGLGWSRRHGAGHFGRRRRRPARADARRQAATAKASRGSAAQLRVRSELRVGSSSQPYCRTSSACRAPADLMPCRMAMMPSGLTPSRLRPLTSVSRSGPSITATRASGCVGLDRGVGLDRRLALRERLRLDDPRHLGDAHGERAVADRHLARCARPGR